MGWTAGAHAERPEGKESERLCESTGSSKNPEARENLEADEEKLASVYVSASGGTLYRHISLRAHVRAADRVSRLQGGQRNMGKQMGRTEVDHHLHEYAAVLDDL